MGALKASVSLRFPSVIRNPRGPALAVEAMRWGGGSESLALWGEVGAE